MGFILSPEMDAYIEAHTTPQGELLYELDRFTHLHYMMPQMLSGAVQGKFLEMLSHMIRPEFILEIGTFTGYSAICLAKGLQAGGKLLTIDIDEELEQTVRTYLGRSDHAGQIDFRVGNALEIIPGIENSIDLVFIDADKENYSNYYDLVFPKVRVGGYILADNVLWSGKVLEGDTDKDTAALIAYAGKVQNDPRVENVMASVRDGIMIARKLED